MARNTRKASPVVSYKIGADGAPVRVESTPKVQGARREEGSIVRTASVTPFAGSARRLSVQVVTGPDHVPGDDITLSLSVAKNLGSIVVSTTTDDDGNTSIAVDAGAVLAMLDARIADMVSLRKALGGEHATAHVASWTERVMLSPSREYVVARDDQDDDQDDQDDENAS